MCIVYLFLVLTIICVVACIKSQPKMNPGIFVIGGLVFFVAVAYFNGCLNFHKDTDQFEMSLAPRPVIDNGELEIQKAQEINPDFKIGNQLDVRFQTAVNQDYPMLDVNHRNASDCTIDGTCNLDTSEASHNEVKVMVTEDQLCQHGKAYNSSLSPSKSIIEGFELTGSSIQNDNEIFSSLQNAPYQQEPSERMDRTGDLCHNCKVGTCSNGTCGSIKKLIV